MEQLEYCICIGRFQPFHTAHHELIREALSIAKKAIIIIGSAGKARSIQNPWTSLERQEMITGALSFEEKERVQFICVRDYWYSQNRWLTEVQSLVYNATSEVEDNQIAILGETNDFPQWKFYKMRSLDRMPHATRIRQMYFTHDLGYKNYLDPSVAEYLVKFEKTSDFKSLKNEFDFIKNYRASWDGAPFQPTFVCVDALVVKSGHVLLVRRKGALGKGLLALPGGFLNQEETTEQGMLRELKEETSIKVSKEDLAKSIIEHKVFDYPGRSLRGRTISHTFIIDLGSGPLPIVKGSDDADKAFWLSFAEISNRESEFFEDHFQILSACLLKF